MYVNISFNNIVETIIKTIVIFSIDYVYLSKNELTLNIL
jgi:hypothetical protein